MSLIDLLGYVAGTLTTLAFFPQALHAWRTRNLTGVSLPMYAIFTSGVALWLVYGIAIRSVPVIVANLITLPLAMLILLLKILEKNKASGD